MLYSNNPRVHYDRHHLVEVICQLRFPTILSIESDPVDFQEAIRGMFPDYTALEERPRDRPGPKTIINHNFVSADKRWKLNLTRNFISLSTMEYPGWEEFCKHFDLPLMQFIRIYAPAFFTRLGLRYVNVFSRRVLKLEDEPWRELIAPPYLGILAEEDVNERMVRKSAQEVELQLDGSCRVDLRSGPVMLKIGDVQDQEVRFMLDIDLFMEGQIDPRMAAAGLEALHGHSTPLFQGAITDKLHAAMEPR